jgi:hypothetical protein
LSQGSTALLAYPRLYGGGLLWALLAMRGAPHALRLNRAEKTLSFPSHNLPQ